LSVKDAAKTIQAAATELCIKQNHRRHYRKLSPFPEDIRSIFSTTSKTFSLNTKQMLTWDRVALNKMI